MTIDLNCGVYQIRNIITNVCYVGQSIDLKDRERHHWSKLKNNKHRNRYLQRSYNKRGKESFIFEILLYCESEELTYYEQFFVDKYVALDLSYNICRECVDSTKGFCHSKETKNRISKSNKGEKNGMFGKHLSEEICRKMSEINKGRIFSDETCKKMSENHADVSGENNPNFGKRGKNSTNFGRHHSKESCKKISDAQKGKKNHNFGKCLSEETRKKLSEDRKGINNPNILKKDTVLNVLKLLAKGMSVAKILTEMTIGEKTVYKIKNGWYDDIYDLPKDDKEI